jgi:hypothetical protein
LYHPVREAKPYSLFKSHDMTDGEFPQWIHEGEDAWPLLDRLLDHDGDAEGHERLRKVRHLFMVYTG